MGKNDKIVINDVPTGEPVELAVTVTLGALLHQIAHMQWVIARDHDYVEEHHAQLKKLYDMRDKMSALGEE